MNTQNNLGIWISGGDDLKKIDSVLSYYNQLDDVFLISDSEINNTEYAVIPSYYVTFEDIAFAFVGLDTWLSNKDSLRSQNITVFCSMNEILQSQLNKNSFNNIRIIEL